MGKRTLILTSETETILNGEGEEKYIKYAKEHDLDISGEIHYPLILSFVDPKLIVDAVERVDSEVIIVDDADFIVANAYHKGQIIKMFEEKGISVVSSEILMNLLEFCKMIDDDMPKELKELVQNTIEETFQDSEERIAVMTVDSSRDEFKDFIKRLSEQSEKVCIIEMPEFDPRMCKGLDFCLKDSDVNKVIVYDDELMTKSMEQYLYKLQTQDYIDVGFMEDYNLVDNQSLNFQGMILN